MAAGRNNNVYPFLRLGLVLVLAAALTGQAVAGDAPLAFGVLNQQSAIRTAERWNPISTTSRR